MNQTTLDQTTLDIVELQNISLQLMDNMVSMSKEQVETQIAAPLVEFTVGMFGVPYGLSKSRAIDGEERFRLRECIEHAYSLMPDSMNWDGKVTESQMFDLRTMGADVINMIIAELNSRMPEGNSVSAAKMTEWTLSQTELADMLSDTSFGGINLLDVVYNQSLREPFLNKFALRGKQQMGAVWTPELEVKAKRLVGLGLGVIQMFCDMMFVFSSAQHLPLPEPFQKLLTKMSEAKSVPKNPAAELSLRERLQVPERYKSLIARCQLTETEAVDKLLDYISRQLQQGNSQKCSRLKGIMSALEQEHWIAWSELDQNTQYRLLLQAFREQLRSGFSKDTFRKEGAREGKIAFDFRQQLRELFRMMD